MNRQRYTLDARAARKVQRAITSTRLPSAARPNEGKNTSLVMCKIEAHEGAGVYQAQEVFWSGSAWAILAGVSRQFGVVYSTPGLGQIAGDTSVAANTIVRAFLFCSQGATSVGDWFFQEGGGGAYTGPFAVTKHPISGFDVGAGRSVTAVDFAIVHPDVHQFTAVANTAAAASGYIYYSVFRETTTAIVQAWAATVPTQTAQYLYIPLAYLTFTGGLCTNIRQLQYGNIIVDKTVSDYCP